MNLYTRLMLSYGYLVTLVLIGAAGAALGFFGLGDRIASMLEDNYDSVRASMSMLEALERQDSAVLTALLDAEHRLGDVESSEQAFYEALAAARKNVSEDAETPVLDTIESRYDTYRDARNRLLSSPPDRPLAMYERECYPQFDSVKQGVRQLLELNHDAMVRADREARDTAARRALGYAAWTGLALLSLGWLARGLRSNLISRLEELRDVSRAIAGGDLRRRVSAQRADELGSVARALNGLLDAHEELLSRSQTRETRLRELLRGRVAAEDGHAAIVGLGGEIVASTFDDGDTAAVTTAAAELPADGPTDREVRVGDRTLRCRLLAVGGRRAVGWWIVEP